MVHDCVKHERGIEFRAVVDPLSDVLALRISATDIPALNRRALPRLDEPLASHGARGRTRQ